MPKLTILTDDAVRETQFSPGVSVRELLEAADIPIRSGCRGNGACGLCRVRIEAGSAGEPSRNERLSLPPDELARSVRLACQVMPQGDLCLRIIAPARPSDWRELPQGHLPCTPAHLPGNGLAPSADADTACGVAVDLGTTHISLSLWDLTRGDRLSARVGLNPQSRYGADVVNRLIAAGESAHNAGEMARLPLTAVREALVEMGARRGARPDDVTRVRIVGNTPMLALLTETDPRALLRPESWTRPFDCRAHNPRDWAALLGVHPEAAVEIEPPFGGFVGSDLLAGILATRLTAQPGGLLIDFGTNSEMALWDGRVLRVTSAAGGPAFESCNAQCGMPAEPGAICRVGRAQDSPELRLEVIGGGEARGLCGSGLVDLIALLRGSGELSRSGKLTAPEAAGGFVVQQVRPSIRLTHRDVDAFQRAKAAIGVGIQTLLREAQMPAADLRRVCVCGAFGRYLNVRNAQAIGLLPDLSPQGVELCGNTALAGCERALLSPAAREELAALRSGATILNLSQTPDFDTLFLENLYLQPLRVDDR